ncbi:MAG: hypothetical protein ABIW76_16775 [Fibrobacteria bacterium]
MRIQAIVCLRLTALLLAATPSLTPAAWVHFDPADSTKVPKKFSETGFYSNWAAKTVTPEAKPFDVNSPLWSDAAVKSRWILVKAGTKVQFVPNEDYYDYPDGAVFVKLFQHDTIPGNPASRIWWETRLLVNKEVIDSVNFPAASMVKQDYWHVFSYKWTKDGSEALLVPPAGKDTFLTVTVKGQKTFRKWTFPSVEACNQCHRQFVDGNGARGRAVLGFFTAQINRPTAADPSMNQIRKLFADNILAWSKPAPTEIEIAAMPKWARLDDSTATLDLRARSYIGANCSGCHGMRGLESGAPGRCTPINFDYFKKEGNSLVQGDKLEDKPVSTFGLEPKVSPQGDTVQPSLITPGYPEISVLLFRMKARDTLPPTDPDAWSSTQDQMPPVGVFEVDTVATQLITKWIAAMPPTPISIRHRRSARSADAPFVRGNLILLSASLRAGKVTLIGLDGRKRDLIRTSEDSFLLPRGLPTGVYMVKSGAKTFKLVL